MSTYQEVYAKQQSPFQTPTTTGDLVGIGDTQAISRQGTYQSPRSLPGTVGVSNTPTTYTAKGVGDVEVPYQTVDVPSQHINPNQIAGDTPASSLPGQSVAGALSPAGGTSARASVGSTVQGIASRAVEGIKGIGAKLPGQLAKGIRAGALGAVLGAGISIAQGEDAGEAIVGAVAGLVGGVAGGALLGGFGAFGGAYLASEGAKALFRAWKGSQKPTNTAARPPATPTKLNLPDEPLTSGTLYRVTSHGTVWFKNDKSDVQPYTAGGSNVYGSGLAAAIAVLKRVVFDPVEGRRKEALGSVDVVKVSGSGGTAIDLGGLGKSGKPDAGYAPISNYKSPDSPAKASNPASNATPDSAKSPSANKGVNPGANPATAKSPTSSPDNAPTNKPTDAPNLIPSLLPLLGVGLSPLLGGSVTGNVTPTPQIAKTPTGLGSPSSTTTPSKAPSTGKTPDEATQPDFKPDTPKPNPPTKEEGEGKCCKSHGDDLAEIKKVLGVTEFPGSLPILTGDEQVSFQNIPELMLWITRCIDSTSGQFPTEIKILDANSVEKKIKLENMSHAIEELFAALVIMAQDSDAAVNIGARVATEVINTKIAVQQGNDILKAIQRFLGFTMSVVPRIVKLNFTPSAAGLDNKLQNQEMEDFLKPSSQNYLGHDLGDTHQALPMLQRILNNSEIVRAAHWHPIKPSPKGEDSITGTKLRKSKGKPTKGEQKSWEELLAILKKMGVEVDEKKELENNK